MEMTLAEHLAEAVRKEGQRNRYPDNFPHMPKIPAGRYRAALFHQLEMEHVWKKVWLFAGHASDIREPGEYFIFEKLDASVIVTRQSDGGIKAFHNSCRHRGSPVVMEAAGKTKRFVCPYHSWTYSLDGSLKAVPEEADFSCLEKESHGLLPVHCVEFRGLIFLSLSQDPEDFGSFADGLLNAFSLLPLEKMSIKGRIRVEVPCNWKAVIDNFNESYHVKTLHQNTVVRFLDSDSNHLELLKNGHVRGAVPRLVDNRFAQGDAPRLPDSDPLFDRLTLGLYMFPNNKATVNPLGFPWISVWPTGLNTSVYEATFLGWDNGDPKYVDYWKSVRDGTMTIVEEDLRVLMKIQKYLNDECFSGLTLSFVERTIYWCNEEIDRRIGDHNIPSDMRVEKVLEPTIDPSGSKWPLSKPIRGA